MFIIIIKRSAPEKQEPKRPVKHTRIISSPIVRGGMMDYKVFATRNQNGGMFGLENQIVLN